jgi:hypothetical protein
MTQDLNLKPTFSFLHQAAVRCTVEKSESANLKSNLLYYSSSSTSQLRMFVFNQFILLLSLYIVTSCFTFESRQKILQNIQDNTNDIFPQQQKDFSGTFSDGENVEVFWINEKSKKGTKVGDVQHKIPNTSTMLNVRNPSSTPIELTHSFLVR